MTSPTGGGRGRWAPCHPPFESWLPSGDDESLQNEGADSHEAGDISEGLRLAPPLKNFPKTDMCQKICACGEHLCAAPSRRIVGEWVAEELVQPPRAGRY